VFGLLTLGFAFPVQAVGLTESGEPEVVIGLLSVPSTACSIAAAAGFTVIHSYEFEVSAFQGSAEFIHRARKYLDEAQEHGLRVLLGLPRSWVHRREATPILESIHALRAHPALAMWYEEELAQSGFPAAVAFLDSLVTQGDPGRGLAIEEALRSDSLSRIGIVRMFTYYPATATARAQGKLVSLRQRFPVETLATDFWPVLQAYGADLVRDFPQPRILTPTRQELRYSLYSSLIAGATGFAFYPYLHPTEYDAAAKQRGAWAFKRYRPLDRLRPGHWRNVVETASSARTLLQLIQRSLQSTILNALCSDCEARSWTLPGGRLMIVAIPGFQEATVTLDSLTSSLYRIEADGFHPLPATGPALKLDLTGPGGIAIWSAVDSIPPLR
jgi:hypothetical protein